MATTTATVTTPANPAWSNLEQELLYQADNCRSRDTRSWFYIELHGTLDDLADSDWTMRASAAELAYKTTRADVLRALINRADAAAGHDISVPLDTRLAAFYRDYLLGRI